MAIKTMCEWCQTQPAAWVYPVRGARGDYACHDCAQAHAHPTDRPNRMALCPDCNRPERMPCDEHR